MAPVGTKSTRFQFPDATCGRIWGGKDRGGTSASASSGMGILSFIVIDQKAAVLMDGSGGVKAFAGKEVQKDFLSDFTQISGDDKVIVRNRTAKIPEIPADRIAGRRSHTAAHSLRNPGARSPRSYQW